MGFNSGFKGLKRQPYYYTCYEDRPKCDEHALQQYSVMFRVSTELLCVTGNLEMAGNY